MAEFPYDIRNYRRTDFNDLVRLYRAAEALEPIGRPGSPQAIAEKLGRPNYSPETDLMVVARDADLVGFLDMVPERAIGRVIVDCWLRPEHRRKVMAPRLLDNATRRARELGAAVIHVNVREDNETAKSVLTGLGFHYVRCFLELRLDMSSLDPDEADRAAREFNFFRPGEEEKLAQFQNRSFAGSWGYNPNTPEMIKYRLSLGHRSPRDVVMAYEGDMLNGYCWTEVVKEGEGRIYMIGTDPDYRGQGLGRKLLLAGLSHLKSKGVKIVWLTVDSANETACALYNSVGFRRHTSYLWYEKAVV
ncbi:MAG: hypothetical protein A2Z05_05185 [Chloroflexi bacterium RBG_16_60_22]|nr:MAG: hypothetical protein A2Z05_05185 [Chloroflexi bacterium RBG_16_60_22]